MVNLVRGAFSPLFDRLTGAGGGVPDDALLDSSGLRLSLGRDLERLFNSTSRLTLSEFLESELSVLDFGLPDFRELRPRSEQERSLLAAVIGKALDAFESRLDMVQVSVDLGGGIPPQVTVAIEGAVRLGSQLRRVDFQVDVMPGAATTLDAA